jgi:hypothetical protein
MSGENSNEEAGVHDAYLEERSLWIQAHGEQTKFIDQITIALAGGGLGLSLTLLHDLSAPLKSANLLYAGSGCLIAAIVAVLCSLHSSQFAISGHIKMLDQAAKESRLPAEVDRMRQRKYLNSAARLTQWLNWIAPVLLVTGIVFLVIFSYANESSKQADDQMKNASALGKIISVPQNSSGVERGIVPLAPAVQRPPQSQSQQPSQGTKK